MFSDLGQVDLTILTNAAFSTFLSLTLLKPGALVMTLHVIGNRYTPCSVYV